VVKNEITLKFAKIVSNTGVARNFDWDGLKIEKFYYLSLETFFGDVTEMTS